MRRESDEGVDPPEIGEASEVGVRRHERKPVLEGQRRQVGVGDQVASKLMSPDEVGEKFSVPRTRDRRPDGVRGKPVLDEAQGVLGQQGRRRRPRMGADTKEGDERLPGDADPTWTVETHNHVTYGRSTDGRSWTAETHNGVVYGESSDGRRWTSETHNGVTYIHPR